jgi:hypothetical protein
MAKRRKPGYSQSRHWVSRDQVSIQGEARYIIERAQEHDARVVMLGPLVFFSTETGDAWMLDPEDGLALCLARGGDEQPFTIHEAPTNFGIEWNANYRIEGDLFVVAERTGSVKSIFGYPVREIAQTIHAMKHPQR